MNDKSLSIHAQLSSVLILFGMQIHIFEGLADDRMVISNGTTGHEVLLINVGKDKEPEVPEPKKVRRVIRCQ